MWESHKQTRNQNALHWSWWNISLTQNLLEFVVPLEPMTWQRLQKIPWDGWSQLKGPFATEVCPIEHGNSCIVVRNTHSTRVLASDNSWVAGMRSPDRQCLPLYCLVRGFPASYQPLSEAESHSLIFWHQLAFCLGGCCGSKQPGVLLRLWWQGVVDEVVKLFLAVWLSQTVVEPILGNLHERDELTWGYIFIPTKP